MNRANANSEVFQRLCAGRPLLHDLKPARDVLPDYFRKKAMLHAGPPIEVDRLCGPVRGGIECAFVYEGWADSYEEAANILSSSDIRIEPNHHHGFVGPVGGIVSPSMWVFCVKNEEFGNWSYCPMSEGMGRALRFGAQGEDVIKRLKWMEDVLGPVLAKAVQKSGGIDLKEIIKTSLEMGDECHNRHEGARLVLLRKLLPHLIGTCHDSNVLRDVTEFIADNYYFFVNVAMAAAKAMTDATANIPCSSLVTAMARNGTDFGIRVSCLGDRWFTAPCNRIEGICFDGYTEDDGNPDLGDSTITETAGFGAFAMAAAPAISRYIGGTPAELVEQTLAMYSITHGEHPDFRIPAFDYRGTPTGIDVLKVVETGITPVINTSIAHKDAGSGQIGAGHTRAPLKCFEQAAAALGEAGIK